MTTKKPVVQLPIYDDFGNHLGMSPETRTYERKVGCWNCKHADTGLIYRERVKQAFQRDAAVFQHRDGMTLHNARIKAHATRQLLMAKMGIFVVCTADEVADLGFVACKHLCDEWSGVPGVLGSLAPGEKLDEPVQALYEDHGEPANDD